jgi:hypothetical protein
MALVVKEVEPTDPADACLLGAAAAVAAAQTVANLVGQTRLESGFGQRTEADGSCKMVSNGTTGIGSRTVCMWWT